jgi:putative PIN family toxin of toxin-antitoxin system
VILAVLDTNLLVSAILIEHGIARRILRGAYEREFACFCSVPIVSEAMRCFARPRIQQRYRVAPREITRLRRFLESSLVLVPITMQVSGVATHPEDDLVLATALSAHADYIVTYDRQLLRLGSHQGVRVVTPYQFLQILETQAAE